MKKFLFLIISIIIVLSGCGTSQSDSQTGSGSGEAPQLIEVSIHTPEANNVNEEVTLTATVTQGNESVEDADEVKFEIRKVGQEESEMIEANHQGKGIYEIKKTFTEDGKYVVTAHVTARKMHNMPSQQISVENPAGTVADTEHQHSEAAGNDSSQGKTEDAHHHHSTVSIDFDGSKEFNVNEKTVLSAHITNENQPIPSAEVRFEIWFNNDHNHEYVDAMKGRNGIYTYEKTFSKAGTYFIKVHVEKGEIHEHKEYTIEVK
ncbi:FixH family protein [Bacillus sp. FJAT-29814]|uniref:FixH family protein n=1 Tax=Bacillus sp. FJAT-29814 TaxID=1729688 RepID=UPI00082A7AD7|nr:FixH family protein [Bacillus sp. FJAT-29814]